MMTLFFWFWWKKVEKFPSWYYISNDTVCVFGFPFPWVFFFSNVSQTIQNIESRCHELYLLCYHLEKREQIPLRSGRSHFSPVIHTRRSCHIIYISDVFIVWVFDHETPILQTIYSNQYLSDQNFQRPNSLDLTSWYVGRESRHKIQLRRDGYPNTNWHVFELQYVIIGAVDGVADPSWSLVSFRRWCDQYISNIIL